MKGTHQSSAPIYTPGLSPCYTEVGMLPVQSLVPNNLKGQNSKTSEFGVKKCLLIETEPAEKMGVLILTSLLKAEFSLLLGQGKGKWEGMFLKNSSLKQNSSN